MGRDEEPSGVDADPHEQEAGQIERLLAQGDFLQASKRARALLLQADLPVAVQQRAQTALFAVRPDLAALWVLAGCLILFGVVIWLTLF